jgi:hypothetical protein
VSDDEQRVDTFGFDADRIGDELMVGAELREAERQ